jgi:tetratricopeptide (TPR) repeat protein
LAFRQGVVGDDAADDLEQATEGDISFPEIDVGGDYTIDSAEDLSTKVPEDPDEAMAWLEQLAAEQGEPTDELITYSDETADDPFAELEEAIVDEDLELALTGLQDVAMPADEDEALIWLAELGGAGGTEFVESSVEELPENEIVIEEDDILEEVVADEIALESEALVEEEVASMATSLATAPEHEEDSQIPIVVSDEVEKIEDDQTSDMVFDQVAGEVEPGPSISSDIAEDDDLAWLDSLDEANVTGWLQSEEALLSDDSSAEIAPQVAPAEIIPELEIVSDQPPSILDELDLADQLGEHESSELSAAQIALKSGQLDEAKVAYSGLIDSGESLPYVISDLETAVAAYDDQLALKRLLGDAYARNGQLQKAIEVYRQALNNL